MGPHPDGGSELQALSRSRLLDELGCDLTGGPGGVAEALFVGIATDTGWFRYPNATAETFALAARLLERGVDKTALFRELEETFPVQRLALQTRALASLEYVRDGAVAIQSLTHDDFVTTGGTVEHLTGLVNGPMVVGAVHEQEDRVPLLRVVPLRHPGDDLVRLRSHLVFPAAKPGLTKASFRSKPCASGGPVKDDEDVSALARRLGGGGHVFAAGARLDCGLEAAKERVRAALA